MWSWFRRDSVHTRPSDERKPAYAAASAQGDPQALRTQAAALVAQGRYDDAAAVHRQAIELDSDSAGGWVHLGHALHGAGRFDEAHDALARALTLDARNEDALYLLGSARRAQGDLPGAIERYRQALVVQPAFEPCRVDLALALTARGEFAPARIVVNEGLR